MNALQKTVTWTNSVTLPVSGGTTEIDLEDAAVDGDMFYITGSHGVAKKSGAIDANRYAIYRFPVIASTGIAGTIQKNTLKSLFAADPVIGQYVDVALQRKGLNIEGMAASSGIIYIGLRSPNLHGNAYVVSIAGDAIFSSSSTKPYTLKALAIGAGYGIRAIDKTQNGFLFIAGNAGSEPNGSPYLTSDDYDSNLPFKLWYWDGASYLEQIGTVPLVTSTDKAEGLMVLSESDTDLVYLGLCDEPTNGAPTAYRIRKATSTQIAPVIKQETINSRPLKYGIQIGSSHSSYLLPNGRRATVTSSVMVPAIVR